MTKSAAKGRGETDRGLTTRKTEARRHDEEEEKKEESWVKVEETVLRAGAGAQGK